MKAIFKYIFLIFFLFLCVNARYVTTASYNPLDDFVTTWKTTTANETITFPTAGLGYNYSMDCDNDGTFEQTGLTGNGTCTLVSPGNHIIRISGNFPRIFFKNSGDKNKILSVNQWGNMNWKSFYRAFEGAKNLDILATDVPKMSNVTNMFRMFRGCYNLKGNPSMGKWDTSAVKNMAQMFMNARKFNQDISTKVINAGQPNEYIAWNTEKVERLSHTFRGAWVFNKNIGNWNTTRLKNLSATFMDARKFNQDLSTKVINAGQSNEYIAWNIQNVTQMQSMFYRATVFNGNIDNWNTTKLKNLSSTFRQTRMFNRDVSQKEVTVGSLGTYTAWNTKNVKSMLYTFMETWLFNQNIGNWNTSKVENIKGIFYGAKKFNQDLSTKVINAGQPNEYIAWDTKKITNMSYIFSRNPVFNGNIDNWNTSKVTTLQQAFSFASMFDRDISQKKVTVGSLGNYTAWDIGAVTTLYGTFDNALSFNKNIGNWNTSNVTTLLSTFRKTLVFNQDINTKTINSGTPDEYEAWDISKVRDARSTFANTEEFNSNLDKWNTEKVTDMSHMFSGAKKFNQNLATFNISRIVKINSSFQGLRNIFNYSGLSKDNYDDTLIGWENQTHKPNITLGARGLKYCRAETARQNLITTDNWNIIGDIKECPTPTPTILNLQTSSDSGFSDTDNITNDTTPSVSGTCLAGSLIQLYIDSVAADTTTCPASGTFNITLATALSNGDYALSYTQDIDGAGTAYLESEASPILNLTIDTLQPQNLSLMVTTDAPFSIDAPKIVFLGTDNETGVHHFTVQIDGGTISEQTSPYTPTITPASSHTVVVTVYDMAGNSIVKTVKYPPVVNITAPTILVNTTIADTTIQVTGPSPITEVIASGAGYSHLSCTPNVTPATPHSGPITCSIQIHSTGELLITARDTSGATGNATHTYTIDTDNPIITFVDDTLIGPNTSETVSIKVVDDHPSISTYTYGFVDNIADCNSGATFSESFTSETPILFSDENKNGKYICAKAEDTIGNTGFMSSAFPLNIDITKPTITITAPTKVSSTAITDTIVTIQDTVGINTTGVTATGGTIICTQVTAKKVTCTANISHSGDLEIKAVDLVGNTQIDAESLYIIDTLPPICGTWNLTPSVPTIGNVIANLTGSTDIGGSNINIDGGNCQVMNNNETCTVTISDFAGNQTVCTSPIVTNIDREAPSLGPIADQNFEENTIITPIQIVTDGTESQIQVLHLPAGLTFDPSTKKIQGTPTTSNLPTGVEIVVIAKDSVGNSSTQKFFIFIKDEPFNPSGNGGNPGNIGTIKDNPNVSVDETLSTDTSVKDEKEKKKPTPEEKEKKQPKKLYKEKVVNGKKVTYSLENNYCKTIEHILDDEYRAGYTTKFHDTKSLHSYSQKNILQLEKSGIVRGKEITIFDPKAQITRSEFLAIVLLAHCYDISQPAKKLPFSDMNNLDTWQARVVQVGYDNKIISGYPEGTFKPNGSISKIEAFAIMMNMRKLQATTTIPKDTYVDKQDIWQEKPLALGEYLGILKAKDTGYKFNPDRLITREDMVNIMTDIIKLYE